MTFQRRHNLFFRRLAFLYAFLCVYPLAFKPLHLIGDLQESAARHAAACARDAAGNSGAGTAAVHAADPPVPPCALCAALKQIHVPAAVTPACRLLPPLSVEARFFPVSLRLNPCLVVSPASARAPPVSQMFPTA